MAATVLVSERNRIVENANLHQVMDQVTEPNYRWFSLQDNTLDGTYCLAGNSTFDAVAGHTYEVDANYQAAIGSWNHNSDFIWDYITAGVVARSIGLDFGVPKSLTLFTVSGNIEFTRIQPSWLAVMYSNDNATWTRAESTDIIIDSFEWRCRVSIYLAGNTTARYFKIVCAAPDGINYTMTSIGGFSDWIHNSASTYVNEIGWWGSTLSDVNGAFDVPPQLQVYMTDDMPDSYEQNWDSWPGYALLNTTVNSCDGLLDLTATTLNPAITMPNIGSFDPTIYRYFTFRYRVKTGTPRYGQVYFMNTVYPNVTSEQYLNTPSYLITDGEWHTFMLDMWAHALWKVNGNITSLRFDWANPTTIDVPVQVQLDYIRLVPDHSSTRSVHTLQVAGDPLLGEYPKDFKVQLYNGTDVIYTESVTNNTSTVWSKRLSGVYDATMYSIEVTKVNKTNRTVKISDVYSPCDLISSDGILVKSIDSEMIANGIYSTDSLKAQGDLSETTSPSLLLYGTDNIKPKLTDASFFPLYERWCNDTLTTAVKAINNGLIFNGGQQRVAVTALSQTIIGDTFTAEVALRSKDVTQNQTILSRNAPFFIQIKSSKLWIGVYTAGAWTWLKGVTTLTNNELYHLALVYDGEYMKGYLNGVLEMSATKSGTVFIDAVYLGYPPTAGEQYPIYGTVYETRLWSVAKTQEELQALVGNEVDVNSPNLELYWKFTERTGTTTYDATANHNNGLLINDPIWNLSEIENRTNDDDFIAVKTTDNKNLEISLTGTESLMISKDIENDILSASFSSSDGVQLKLNESMELTNVHSRMNDSCRQIHAKVEVTYTDPFLDDTIDIQANSTAYNTDPTEVADSSEVPAYKWFSLSDNTLDGSYGLIDSSKEYSTGWWSSTLSNATGGFTTAPTLTVQFEPRALYSLKVTGDSKLNNYPVDFTINCYGTDDLLLDTYSVTGNTEVAWNQNIETLLDVTKLELKITKINRAYDTAKITEFFTAIVETYYNEDLIDLSLLEELEYPSGSMALGSISANELDITFDNSSGRFNPTNSYSSLHNLLKRNRRIRAWLGTEVVVGDIEWHPLGTFWTLGWEVPDGTMEARTTARDRLEILRRTDFTVSQVYEDYNLYQLFEIILQDADLTSVQYHIDSSLSSIVIPYAWFDRMTHRDALQRLASCAYIQVYCDRDGIIRIEQIDTSTLAYFTFDDDLNIYNKTYPTNSVEVTNHVEVSAQNITVKEVQEVLNVDETFEIAAGETLERIYSFNHVPVKNVQTPAISGTAALDVVAESYAWGIKLTITNNNGTACTVSNITAQGQPLELSSKTIATAKDDISIRDNGRLQANVEHDFIQSLSYAQGLAETLLESYSGSSQDVSINSRGNIGLYLGHKIQVNDERMNTHYDYITQRQAISWNGALNAVIDGKKV